MPTMRIEMMALAELKAWPRNPKGHDLDQLRASMDRFGYVMPPAIDERTGLLFAGHGRIETLVSLFEKDPTMPPKRIVVRDDGEWLVPVLRGVAFDSEAEAEAYLLADNKLAELGGWTADLTDFLARAQETHQGLAGIGFTLAEVDELAKAKTRSLATPPEAPPEGGRRVEQRPRGEGPDPDDDDRDEPRDKPKPGAQPHLRFEGQRLPMSDAEAETLRRKLAEHVEVHGSLYGFAGKLLRGA